MLEGIQHAYSTDTMTGARYCAEGVTGSISFSNTDGRSCVISSIGTLDATRECSLSYWVGNRKTHRSAARESVENYV